MAMAESNKRVLLLSPLPGLDPPNGDITYTQQLLANPPAGYKYVTYSDALEQGSLRELNRRATQVGTGGLGLVREAIVNRGRRRQLLFREPFRHFDVQPGAFDLIHCHVFSAAFRNRDCPLIVSNACPAEWLYRDGLGWRPSRVKFGAALDRLLARSTNVVHSVYGARRADLLVVFSETVREWYIARGYADPDRVVVVPPYVDLPDHPRRVAEPPRRIGFVGDFAIKGGDVVLDAFAQLRNRYPEVSLAIVGSTPRMNAETMRRSNISWQARVPREQLLGEIMPTFDVFAYPTRFDGLPLTLLEVMALGVPIAASDYGALPEMLGKGGLTSPRKATAEFVGNLELLLDADVNKRTGMAARQRAAERYSRVVTTPAIRSAYDHLVG
jgi:glycosyltransferase involved in cell wall biosynthesis